MSDPEGDGVESGPMADSPPPAAVLIPTRDRPDDLRRSLASLVPAARSAGAEVLVCDQSSRPFADAGPWRLLHRPELAGLPAARNLLLRRTAAPVVVFCDDDVDVPPDLFGRLLSWLRQRPDLVACGPIAERRAPWLVRGHRLVQLGAQRDDRRLIADEALVPLRALFGCCFAVRRHAALAVGFDARRPGYALGEDADFFLRLPGAKLAIDEPGFVHRCSGAGRADPIARGRAKAGWHWQSARHRGRGDPAAIGHLLLALAAAASGAGREPAAWRGVAQVLWHGGPVDRRGTGSE